MSWRGGIHTRLEGPSARVRTTSEVVRAVPGSRRCQRGIIQFECAAHAVCDGGEHNERASRPPR